MLEDTSHRGLPVTGHRTFAVCCRLLLAVGVLGLFGQRALSQDTPENQKKAILISKLTRLVEWPKEKSAMGVPLVIGVYGNDMISDQIREVANRQKINGRDVVVRNLTTVQEIMSCHILYIPASAERELSAILWKARGEPILTIGETPGFLKKGGNVIFITADSNVTMFPDARNAKRSDLKLSPMLFPGETPFGG
jgi:hypothetical protein